MSKRTMTVVTSLCMALTGFLLGYIGPIYWAEGGSGQGPLLGLFFTGPFGAIAGGFLGAKWAQRDLSKYGKMWRVLLASVVYGFLTIVVALSDIWPSARIVEAVIESCNASDQHVIARKAFWQAEIQRLGAGSPIRDNWEAELSSMSSGDAAVILTLGLSSTRWVREYRWRGRAVAWVLGPRKQVAASEKVVARFGGARCKMYPTGERTVLMLVWIADSSLPPARVSTFLDVWVAEKVPSILEH